MTQLFVAASVSMLIYYNSVRRRHHLSRSGILQPTRSSWRHLYGNGNEGSFQPDWFQSRVAFEEMHKYLYSDVHAQQTGRPRLLNSRDAIGLILFYLGSSMCLSEFCIILGALLVDVVILSNRTILKPRFSGMNLFNRNNI